MSPDKKRQCVGFIQTFNSAGASSFCPINPFSLPLNHAKVLFLHFRNMDIHFMLSPKKRSIPLLFVGVKESLRILRPPGSARVGPPFDWSRAHGFTYTADVVNIPANGSTLVHSPAGTSIMSSETGKKKKKHGSKRCRIRKKNKKKNKNWESFMRNVFGYAIKSYHKNTEY